jgi:hypothetical protein
VALQEGGDGVLVFVAAKRAGGIDEQAAGFHARGVGGQDFELRLVECGNRLGLHIPFEVGLAAPGAGTGAGGINEDAVVGLGGFCDNSDVVEAGALRTVGQFVEYFRTDVGGVDVAVLAEQAGELERLATGAGAGIEPAAGERLRHMGEDELRAEVLDFNKTATVGIGDGDLGVGWQAEGVGKIGGRLKGPALRLELIKDEITVLALQADPEIGAAV